MRTFPFSLLLRAHACPWTSPQQSGRPVASPVPQYSSCDFPQEGALDLLKKLNSCQMSIQLLQVGGGALGVVPLREGGKDPVEVSEGPSRDKMQAWSWGRVSISGG